MYMHIILSFKIRCWNSWGWSVRPKYAACVDETNKIRV